MELSTPSPSGPHVFLSPGVFVSRLVNNNLTFILNLNQTSFPENTSVTLSPGQNGNFDYPCPPISEEKLRLIEALEEATEIQVDTIFSIALIFGLPGSVLALVIVSSMAACPTTWYMSSLSMSDLATLFLASLTSYKVTTDSSLTLFDKNSIYVCRIFQAFSHWNLALICVERFVSVRYPFQKSRLYTRRAMFLSVGAAFIVSSVPFPVSYLSGLYYDFKYTDLELAQTILYKLIYIIIPGGLIMIFTILTACHLRRNVRHRETIASQSEQNSRRSVTMEAQLTRMMFVTVVCFVVFTFPWAFIHIFDRVKVYVTDIPFCTLDAIIYKNVFYTLWAVSFLNHAANFYVYCACAKGFRDRFVRVICCKKEATRR